MGPSRFFRLQFLFVIPRPQVALQHPISLLPPHSLACYFVPLSHNFGLQHILTCFSLTESRRGPKRRGHQPQSDVTLLSPVVGLARGFLVGWLVFFGLLHGRDLMSWMSQVVPNVNQRGQNKKIG